MGNPLTSSIDAFIGIAGANQGLVNCLGAFTPICSTDNGLYPGSTVTDPSTFLQNINSQSGYEGSRVYSLWSVADEIILYGCVVGNQKHVESQIKMVKSNTTQWGIFNLENQTETLFSTCCKIPMSKNNISMLVDDMKKSYRSLKPPSTSMTRPVK